MIVFNLTCGNDQSFECWFAPSAEVARHDGATQLNCPLCGDTSISKGLQAPYVNTGSMPPVAQTAQVPAKAAPSAPSAQAQYMNVGAEVKRMIEQLIANTEDVGNAFPEEA